MGGVGGATETKPERQEKHARDGDNGLDGCFGDQMDAPIGGFPVGL